MSNTNPVEVSPMAVDLGPPTLLMAFGKSAAVPAISIQDDSLARTMTIAAPGAAPSNTEVRWDEATRRLWVGVWSGRRPLAMPRPLRFPVPEVAWLTSFWLPCHQGAHARLTVTGGRITVQAPSVLAPSALERAAAAAPARPRVLAEASAAPLTPARTA